MDDYERDDDCEDECHRNDENSKPDCLPDITGSLSLRPSGTELWRIGVVALGLLVLRWWWRVLPLWLGLLLRIRIVGVDRRLRVGRQIGHVGNFLEGISLEATIPSRSCSDTRYAIEVDIAEYVVIQ